MLLANKMYIGACTNRLTYTASNGNADVTLNGISEKEVYRYYRSRKVIPYRNNQSRHGRTESFSWQLSGIVAFNYANWRNYEGYVTDINEMIGKSQTTSYGFICRKNRIAFCYILNNLYICEHEPKSRIRSQELRIRLFCKYADDKISDISPLLFGIKDTDLNYLLNTFKNSVRLTAYPNYSICYGAFGRHFK